VFGLCPATRIYLAAGITDMRKGFEGLYGLVRDRLSCDPLSGRLFLFCDGPKRFLGQFEGILQTDGYAAYDQIGGSRMVYAACWSHYPESGIIQSEL
jgi:hypothetical protein